MWTLKMTWDEIEKDLALNKYSRIKGKTSI